MKNRKEKKKRQTKSWARGVSCTGAHTGTHARTYQPRTRRTRHTRHNNKKARERS